MTGFRLVLLSSPKRRGRFQFCDRADDEEGRTRFTRRSRQQTRMPALDTFRRLAYYRIMSQVFKALSDPTRRRVLQLLRKGPMSAGDLSDQFDVSKPTMSAHFAVLREADLVHAEKVGKSVIYQLKLSVLE